MSSWLAFATQLVGLKKPDQLATKFVEVLTRELQLSRCLILFPNPEGRMLVPHNAELSCQWSVTDLNNPFTQVLQTSQSMTLSADDVVFWRGDRYFSQLVENVGMFEAVHVQPLPIDARHVQSVLMMVGEQDCITSIFADAGFLQFVDLFTKQWNLLTEMMKEEQEHRVLKASFDDFEKDSMQRALAQTLEPILIGQSDVMQRLRRQIASAATSQLSVMVQGETGTGKELVAQAVHQLSSRKKAPFVAINCAAIPESLLESELFGYKKGAFSGADSDKQGLIAQANGGTLFLDEIGDMPLSLQAKLLRVLETRSFRPVGGKEEQTSDFRLVSATHVNLLAQVRDKQFRQDLYYRLFQYPLTLPKLSARKEDIDQLSQHFVVNFNQQHGTNIRGIHYRALDCLKRHDFPGNVRELKHLVEFGCAQTEDGTQVEEACFASRISLLCEIGKTEATQDHAVVSGQNSHDIKFIDDLKQALSDYEAQIIRDRLQQYEGDRAKAAQSLGIPKRTLAYKCQKLEIKSL